MCECESVSYVRTEVCVSVCAARLCCCAIFCFLLSVFRNQQSNTFSFHPPGFVYTWLLI